MEMSLLYVLAALTSAAGGPRAVGPAEVGSISLGKRKAFSFLFEHCASPPSAEGVSLKPEIAVPKSMPFGERRQMPF